MEYQKRYIKRLPIVGDTVECISNPFNFGDYKVGYEYVITKLGNGYIVVTGDRMPVLQKEIIIHDGHYLVFEYVPVEPPKEPKETHIKEFKLFGIKLFTRKKYIYDGIA